MNTTRRSEKPMRVVIERPGHDPCEFLIRGRMPRDQATHPALSARCAWCCAEPETPCLTRSGKHAQKPHRLRIKEYTDSREGRRALALAAVEDWRHDHPSRVHPDNTLMYRPGDRMLPPDGAWIEVTRVPPQVQGNDQVRGLGRVFYAERPPETHSDGFMKDSTHKVVINGLVLGPAYLYPYEYRVVRLPELYSRWQAGDLRFHPLNIEQARFSLVTFYARSRGIGLADAAAMALGELGAGSGWFTPRPRPERLPE